DSTIPIPTTIGIPTTAAIVKGKVDLRGIRRHTDRRLPETISRLDHGLINCHHILPAIFTPVQVHVAGRTQETVVENGQRLPLDELATVVVNHPTGMRLVSAGDIAVKGDRGHIRNVIVMS